MDEYGFVHFQLFYYFPGCAVMKVLDKANSFGTEAKLHYRNSLHFHLIWYNIYIIYLLSYFLWNNCFPVRLLLNSYPNKTKYDVLGEFCTPKFTLFQANFWRYSVISGEGKHNIPLWAWFGICLPHHTAGLLSVRLRCNRKWEWNSVKHSFYIKCT